MSASGMLRPNEVIFYHPLDDSTEYTQDQLWSGGAVFVPGEIDDACAGVSGDTFIFDLRYDSSIWDTDGKTPHAIHLDETHSVLIVSNALVKVASISGTNVTFSSQAAGGSWYDAILARDDEEDYWRVPITVINKIGLYTINKSTYSPTWDGYTTMSGVNNIGVLGGDGRFLAIDTNGIATVCSISGTSILFGSGTAYTSATSFLPTAVAGLSSGCAVVIFRDNDAPRNGAAVAVVATISGTDISFGAETQITANGFAIAADNDDRRAYVSETSSSGFVLAGRQQVSPYDGYAYAGIVSGTNVNFGSGAKFYSGAGSQRGPESIHAGYSIGSKVPVSYYVRWSDPSWYSKAFCNVFSVSGTTIDVGTPIEFYGESVGGYTIGAASVFLTENKLIAQYRDEPDTNKTKVVIGQPAMEAAISAVTPVVYPVCSGNSRIVIATWATNITKELSTVTIQRDYKITLNETTIELGPDSASWSDVEALSTGQMNDGSSHLLVLDFEHIVDGIWNLNTSYDGGAWVDEGSGVGTRTISPSSLAPSLQIEDGFSDQWIDELVIWGGDKTTFDKFTSDELTNIYNLASIREQGMDKYDEGPLLISVSCDLLITSTGSINTSGDLFICGHGETQSSGDVFINGHINNTVSGDLFACGHKEVSASGDLFMSGPELVEVSGDLFSYGNDIVIASGDLYINGHYPILVSGDLFVFGDDQHVASGDMYANGHEVLLASGDLFVEGISFTPRYASGDMFTCGHDAKAVSGELFVDGYGVTSISGDIFIHGYIQSVVSENLYINGHEPNTAFSNLFLHGTESLPTSGNLFIEGCIETSGVSTPTLFIHGYDNITTSGDMLVHGHDSKVGSGNLFTFGYEDIVASGNLFVHGDIETSGASSPPLFIHGYGDIISSGNLFIESHIEIANSGNLFILGHKDVSESGNLYIQGYECIIASGNLYVNSHIDTSGQCDLCIIGEESGSVSSNMFIHGYNIVTALCNLYTDGNEPVIASSDLFTNGHINIPTSGNLYVDGYINISDQCNLFITGEEPNAISVDMFIHGHITTSVSGDLFTFGHGTTSKSGNLFVQGIDNRAIYWADSVLGKIQRSLLNGTSIVDVVNTDLPEIQSLVIDSDNDKIYFGDAINDKIERVNPNGTYREDVITSGIDRVRGMDISYNLQKLYWADAGLRVIKRSNLDGSDVETIISLGVGSILQRIAINDSEGKIYWTDENLSGPTIKKSNLNGTSIQTIVSSSLSQPREIAVDVVTNKIYWVDAIDDSVEQADLDGSNRTTISTIDGPQAIAIDTWEQKLYVGTWVGKIYKLNVDGTNKEEIVDTGGVIRAIDFGFIDYVPPQSGSVSLFIFAPPPDIYDIIPLYLHGPGTETGSSNIFVHGYDSLAASGNLFTLAPPPDIYDTRPLYMRSPEPETNGINMFVCGRVSSTWTIAPRIDWLLKTQDYNPQIIGLLDSLASGVNIEVWDITGGDNTVISLTSSVCYAIGTTSRWGWSTANLPVYRGYKKHYFYKMTSNLGDTFEGQFLLDVPEHARWIHPANQSEYIQ